MANKVIDKFLARCIKELPKDDYLSYTKNCIYQVTKYINHEGKLFYDVPDDYLGGIGSGLPENEFNNHFRKLTKKELKDL